MERAAAGHMGKVGQRSGDGPRRLAHVAKVNHGL
jgi:hypothetical protein